MMEKTKIGVNAGKVWRILNEKGELSMFDLCRDLGLTFEDVALAIGWLARENKIFLRKKDEMLFAKHFLFFHAFLTPFDAAPWAPLRLMTISRISI